MKNSTRTVAQQNTNASVAKEVGTPIGRCFYIWSSLAGWKKEKGEGVYYEKTSRLRPTWSAGIDCAN